MEQAVLEPITVRRARGESAFLDSAQTWRDLFAGSPEATPFQSWEWMSAWWRNRGQGEPLLLIACEGETPIAGMALVTSRYLGLPLRRLKWMGDPDSDYQSFVGVHRRDECVAAFVAELRKHRDWDFCEFNSMRPDVTRALSTALGAPPVASEGCMTLTLPQDRAGLEELFGRHNRKGILQRVRMLRSERGACAFSTVQSRDEVQPAIDDLFRLHVKRRKTLGSGGSDFADDSALSFHQDLAAAFLERGWLRLHRLHVGDQCIAAAYCFHFGEATYFYQSGFDPDFSRYSPGMLLINYAIGAAVDDGAREFDFMRGEEDYKARWRAVLRPNGQIVFGHSGLVSRAAVTAQGLKRVARRYRRAWRDGGAEGAAVRPVHSSNTPSSA